VDGWIRNRSVCRAARTGYDDPLGHLHERAGDGEQVLAGQDPRVAVGVRGHLQDLWDPHALADALSVLQVIVDPVHLGHLRRGRGEDWPTHTDYRQTSRGNSSVMALSCDI